MGKKVVVVVLIHKLLDERNMSMRQLSLQSGVRLAALHALANQQRQNIHFPNIEQTIDEIITWVDIDDHENVDD